MDVFIPLYNRRGSALVSVLCDSRIEGKPFDLSLMNGCGVVA